ncbi:MAG: flagellar basal body rod C-terminal domain-containing protein, partial [Gemmatimonadota bacterium]|nr:flagellar basal body rod C-terminal domain-containing protein [Gemmatimonadota bacterium]
RSYVPTDIDFFQGENAGDMALSYEISSDPGNIATSKSGAPGDNENALALAQLRSDYLLKDNSYTFEDYYASIVSTFGLEALSVQQGLDNQTRLVDHLDNYRESLLGVNLDEELINLVRFQQAYGANARILTTVNELLGITVLLGRY